MPCPRVCVCVCAGQMRLCNPELTPTSEGRATMGVVVPFLLREGTTVEQSTCHVVFVKSDIACWCLKKCRGSHMA